MKKCCSWPMILVISAMALSACSARRPALYPNEHLRAVGLDAAEGDVDQCIELAKTHGVKHNPVEGAAAATATDATVGAASGAAVGAIYDNSGQGALAGAVGSSVSGLMRRLLRPRPPDPAYQAFVERCLREKGYEPMHWR